jgi:hypothetical protein
MKLVYPSGMRRPNGDEAVHLRRKLGSYGRPVLSSKTSVAALVTSGRRRQSSKLRQQSEALRDPWETSANLLCRTENHDGARPLQRHLYHECCLMNLARSGHVCTDRDAASTARPCY